MVEKLVTWFLNWLTLGPLKGHRTRIIALVLFALSGARALGWLAGLDEQTYASLTTALTAALGLTAAAHKPS